MDDHRSEGWTAADRTASSDTDRPRPDDAGPTADPDDEFFAVLDADVLGALVDVHSRGLDDVLVFVEEGHGVVARNRGGENCYWVQTEIAADDFDVFRATDLRTSLDVSTLEAGLDRARPGERVSLHYSDEEGLGLGVGTDRYPIRGDSPDLSEELQERDAFPTTDGDARPEIAFEIDASRFGAFAGPDTGYTHVRVRSDTNAGSVSFALVGHPDDREEMAFEVPDEDLISPPAETGWGDDDHGNLEEFVTSAGSKDVDLVDEFVEVFEDTPDTATSYLCTESVDPAVSPVRGPVRVLHSEGRPSTRFTYARAGGALTVRGLVSHRLDEVEGLP